MDVLAAEMAFTIGVPSVLFFALSMMTRAWGPRRQAPVLDALWFAVAFAYGQTQVIGALPWPPTETSHALVGLGFAGLAGAAWPRGRIVAALVVLNIGMYFVLGPLVQDGGLVVAVQWGLAHGLLGLLVWVARRPSRWTGAGLALTAAILGAGILSGGSTSLAMTAWLLASLTAVRWLSGFAGPGPTGFRKAAGRAAGTAREDGWAGFAGPGPTGFRKAAGRAAGTAREDGWAGFAGPGPTDFPLWPAFMVLLTFELHNYVL